MDRHDNEDHVAWTVGRKEDNVGLWATGNRIPCANGIVSPPVTPPWA